MSNLRIEKPFEKDFRQKRIMAFLTMCMALFCLFCFLTSTAIRDFSTITELQITSDIEDTQSLVQSIVETEITDQNLAEIVSAAANNADIVANTDIATRNLESIRNALDIQLTRQDDPSKYTLSIHYIGQGTDCEKYLTKTFAQQIASRLDSRSETNVSRDRVTDLIAVVQDQCADFSNNHYTNLETSLSQINQINAQLSDVHVSVQDLKQTGYLRNPESKLKDGEKIRQAVIALDQIREGVKLLGQPGFGVPDHENLDQAISDVRQELYALQENSADLQSGPIRVVNTSLPTEGIDTKPILSTLENVDTDSLQYELGQLRDSIQGHAVKVREKLTELQLANHTVDDGYLVVDSMMKLQTKPVQTAPGLPHLLLFGFISTFVAAAVAMAYQPALEGIGYESATHVSQKLGIPVVAETNRQDKTSKKRSGGIANTIVRISEVVLFAFLLLIILLCIVQADIREAMFANPLHGLAKISALFFG